MVRLSWNVVIDHEQVGNGRIAGPTRLRVTWLNPLGLVFLMLSCVHGPAVSAADREPGVPLGARTERIADVLRTKTRAFWDAWAGADVDAGLGYLSEDATAITRTGVILRGRSSIDAAWRPGFRNIVSQDISFDTTLVSVYGPDLGSVHQVGAFLVFRRDGSRDGPIPFTYTTVWLRRNGTWEIIVAHRTDPLELGETGSIGGAG